MEHPEVIDLVSEDDEPAPPREAERKDAPFNASTSPGTFPQPPKPEETAEAAAATGSGGAAQPTATAEDPQQLEEKEEGAKEQTRSEAAGPGEDTALGVTPKSPLVEGLQDCGVLSGQNEDSSSDEEEDSLMSDGGDSAIDSEEEGLEQVAARGAAQKRGGEFVATAGAVSADAFPFLVTKLDSGKRPEMYLRRDVSSFLLLKMGRQELNAGAKVELDLTLGSSDDATVFPTSLHPHASSNYAGMVIVRWSTVSDTLQIFEGDTAVFSYRGLINGRPNFRVEKQAAAAGPPPAAALDQALECPPQLQVPDNPPKDGDPPIFSYSPSETAKAKKRRSAEGEAGGEKLSDEEEERELGPATWTSPQAPTPGAGPSSAIFAWGEAGIKRRRVASPIAASQWSDEVEPPSAGTETVFEMEVKQNDYFGGLYLNAGMFARLLGATTGLQPLQLATKAVPVELQLGKAKVLHCVLKRERNEGNCSSGRLSGWRKMKSSLGLEKGDILRLTFVGHKTAAAPSTKKKVVLRMRKQAEFTVRQNGQQQETTPSNQQVQQRQQPSDARLPTLGVTESSVWKLFEAMLPELVLEAQKELEAEGYTQDAADVAAIEKSLRERFLEKEMVELMEEGVQ